jgi:hypothetical protein
VESVLEDLSASMGTRRACAQVGVARPTWFRHRQPPEAEEKIVRVRIPPSRALNPDERPVIHHQKFKKA